MVFNKSQEGRVWSSQEERGRCEGVWCSPRAGQEGSVGVVMPREEMGRDHAKREGCGLSLWERCGLARWEGPRAVV